MIQFRYWFPWEVEHFWMWVYHSWKVGRSWGVCFLGFEIGWEDCSFA